jgi:hypothetical protein
VDAKNRSVHRNGSGRACPCRSRTPRPLRGTWPCISAVGSHSGTWDSSSPCPPPGRSAPANTPRRFFQSGTLTGSIILRISFRVPLIRGSRRNFPRMAHTSA